MTQRQRRSQRERRIPTAGDLHRQWLELVDTDGPFLSVPELTRVYAAGIPQPPADAIAALKDAKPAFEKAWEDWDAHREAPLERYQAARDTWVQIVLRDVLGWTSAYGPSSAAAVRSPDQVVAVAAAGALHHGDVTGALVLVVDPVDSLRDPLTDGWATSPIDRMEELLRAASVPIGLVTDGRWWAIVSARPETMVASGIVDAQTWVEEPPTRNAFIELLSRRRLVAGRAEDRLPEMFKASVAAAEEITEALGVQVRRAVELLVQALSEAALDARGRGEPDPLPANRSQVYEAAVTVLMRVVFLLFAEERGLLPQGRLFTAGYGISAELDSLDGRALREGSEALDATHLTWHRLLASSLALYRGASFEDLRLPSYGGSLFDPDRFAFLSARSERGPLVLTVSDRVMLEVLRAVQVAQLKGKPARRISFRDIDVEQIGYIYEGLLGYSCVDVDEVTVGLIGKPGEEPELTLAELESLAEQYPDAAKQADAILATVKVSQPAASPVSRSALTKAIGASDEIEDADRALRAVTTSPGLRERLRPFVGIIRRDLRDRPLVVQRGGLVVVETPSRATAGAHYTPRSLAEEVVKYALEPLIYDPGPHQKPDSADWVPLSSDRLLDLKIADIACGSGAFLVAAARYLAARLVEAYHREGVATGSAHDLHTQAIRKVVANCLYGADINGMAVEMCKLSLWLVSLDPKLPFSFVDDKVLHGNSLLGLTDERQLKYQNIDPDAAGSQMMLSDLDVDGVLARAVSLRRRLATEVDDADPQRSATTKRRQWREYQELTRTLTDVADGVVAAGLRLGGKPSKALREAYENLQIAIGDAYPVNRSARGRTMLDGILEVGLTPTVETDYRRWKPLHWILAVPDVMERGGFDAVISNPPFLGGKKISATSGSNFREWLTNQIAGTRRGESDLAGYFFLRSLDLVHSRAVLGLIVTESLSEGEARRVVLDHACESRVEIMRAVKRRAWPGEAGVHVSLLWATTMKVGDKIARVCDSLPTFKINSSLEPASNYSGIPVELKSNEGLSFMGSILSGKGFVLGTVDRAALLRDDPRCQAVVRPYFSGDDYHKNPEIAASQFVIDFGDMSLAEASTFGPAIARVERLVKRDRDRNKKKQYRERWWLFAERGRGLQKALHATPYVLVIGLTRGAMLPVRVPSGAVFSNSVGVIALGDFASLAILSSFIHVNWALRWGSSFDSGTRYTPTDVFRTFPRPSSLSSRLEEVGERLDRDRRQIMLRRNLGLTDLYAKVNDRSIAADGDVEHLRELHVEIDNAAIAAYGWGDLAVDHGFHAYRQSERFTVAPAIRIQAMDRLLKENHRLAALQGEALPLTEAKVREEVDE